MPRRRLIALLGCLALLLVSGAEYDSLRQDVGPVGDFTLTERDGESFTPEQLRGKVWVAHFFFTTCTGPCTKTVPTMRRLQETFRGKPDVALVSITVRPAHDTLAALRTYADDLGADSKQWLFLTGSEDDVYRIIQTNFRHGAGREKNPKDPTQDVWHSPALVVVDRDGNIRGYLDGTDPEAAARIVERVRELARSKYLLPAVNAALNGTCALLLVLGYVAIRRRRETAHMVLMMTALLVSTVFLALYLYFHIVVQHGAPTRFRGVGAVWWLYMAVLLSHTILAAAVAPLALIVATLGLLNRRAGHRRLARWALPMWLYVSITGVVVYVMLYVIDPPY